MSADRKHDGHDRHDREGFLGRWSRVKTDARAGVSSPVPGGAAPPAAPVKADADTPMPDLPPVEELTLDSDFSGFFHPKVDEDLRRSALRKLFSDPHFNVMDGLDTYIDDYSKSEPIPPAMLAGMRQAQRILEWAAETQEEAEARRSGATPGAVEDVHQTAEDAQQALAAPADDTTIESTSSAQDLDTVPNSKA